jgi:N-acetylneuraminate synthase/pseudaminic acid synthase
MKFLDKIQNGVYFIAEMSANHAGNLNNALEIVQAAKESGADCLKLQTYTADTMTIDCENKYFSIKGGLWDGYKLYDLYKQAHTPWEWHKPIKEECEKYGLDFLSTPFDKTAVDFLEELGVEFYKIASFELVDIPLIEYVARKGKPMIISCGMGSIEEIQDAVDACKNQGNEQIILLKCTSEYPAIYSDMNVATITNMQERFGVKVGLSDHSMGHIAPVVAASLGACVIEKHFCLSRKIKNPDSDFSMEPQEFKEMVENINTALEIKGKADYSLTEKEKASIMFRRSIFAVKDIQVGEEFNAENISIIRPGYGVKPKYYNSLIEKCAKKSYKYGEPINDEDIVSDK